MLTKSTRLGVNFLGVSGAHESLRSISLVTCNLTEQKQEMPLATKLHLIQLALLPS